MPTPRSDGVFVSSVYTELKDYRRAALDAVWRCNLQPIGMEREDIAKPETTIEASRDMLDEAAVYVGIFAFRYGLVTAEEFEYAEQRKIPILIFLAESPLNEDDTEENSSAAQDLELLKAKVKKRYTVAYFHTPEELGVKLQRSLLELSDQGKVTSTKTQRDIIPHPPTPYYAHPYVAGSAGFIGRAAELSLLDSWGESSEPVLIVEAIGGAGKSALAWEWTHSHLARVFPQRTGVLWWSFYESNATMGGLLARGLAYLSGRPLDECARMSRGEQEEQFLGLLSQRPVALILDGVERLLLAYHRLDAPHLTDEAVAAAPRSCIDPRDGTLLRALTSATTSKVLITTRLTPQDLQDKAGQLLQGVRRIELSGLRTEDALQLFEEMGVHGDPALIRNFLAQFGDHALLIQALAGRIRDYREAPGDFDAWYQAVGRTLQLGDQELVARQASILRAALADLDPEVFRLLCNLAAFRYPVDYAAVKAISPFRVDGDPDAGLTPLHAALGTLEERGLVQWDRKSNRYDLHPVVRAYAYGKLEDKETTYAQVKGYFQALPRQDTEQAQDVADLRVTLELYHALLNSGQPDDALGLYRDRLNSPLFHGLGAYATMVEVLSPLFPHGFDQPPTLHSVADQAWTANDLALALNSLGDSAQAQRMFAIHNRLYLEERNARQLAAGLINFGLSLQEGGHLAAAERACQLALDLAQAAHEQVRVDIAHLYLVRVRSHTGNWAQGEIAYAAVQASPDDYVKALPLTFIQAARLRWGQGQDPAPLLDQGLRGAREERFVYVEREAQSLIGEVAFARGDLPAAQAAWQEAYATAQREGVPLGPFLADLARVQAAQGNGAQAKALLAEALALGGLGVALAAVEVYSALGEPAEAKQFVDTAYREAWADGPPYAFVYELGRIRTALQRLGLPEPQLPPYDPSRVQPIPDEAEIRAFIEELKREQQSEADEDDDATPVASNGKRPWWKFWSQN
jgi:tetratricopeptide (TPR) repeat protein